jgi:hypothetical protein
MAEQTVAFRIEVKGTKEQNEQIAALTRTLDQLKAAQTANKRDTDEARVAFEKNKIAIAETQKQLAAVNRTIEINTETTRKLGNSYNDLTEQNRRAAAEIRKLDDPLGKNYEEFRRLSGIVKTNTDKLKEMDAAMGRHQRNVGNYGGQIKAAAGNLGLFSREMGVLRDVMSIVEPLYSLLTGKTKAQEAAQKSATAATTLGSKAMGVLKAAIASTGIGALVVAVASLYAYFTQTARGAELFGKIIDGLSAAFKVIVDRASLFGEAIIDAVRNPRESIKKFGEFLINNIVNRFKAVIDIVGAAGSAIKALATRDMEGLKKAVDDGTTAIKQLYTGLDKKQQEGIKDFFKGVGTEIANEATEAAKLRGELEELEDAERALKVANAERNAEVAKLRLEAAELNKTEAERQKLLQKAIDLENQSFDAALALEKERLRILEAQKALGENLDEDEDELAEQRAKVFELEAQRFDRIRSLKAKEQKLDQAQLKDEKAALTERQKFLDQLAKDEQDARELEQKDQEEANKAIQKETAAKEEAAKERAAIDVAERDSRLAAIDAVDEATLKSAETQRLLDEERKKRNEEFLKSVEDRTVRLAQTTQALLAQASANEIKDLEDKVSAQDAIIDSQRERGILSEQEANAKKEKNKADFEKKKLEIERKAYETKKKFDIAFATLEYAKELSAIYANAAANPTNATTFGAAGIAQAAALTALASVQYAANIALISSQKFHRGGVLRGASHADGGIPFTVAGRGGFEAEGGEAIINKRSTAMYRPLLSEINAAGGGRRFAFGGVPSLVSLPVKQTAVQRVEQNTQVQAQPAQRVYVVESDITTTQRRVSINESIGVF